MSLAFSGGSPKGDGPEGWVLCRTKKTEKTPRSLQQPCARQDAALTIHVNGNTKPSEPQFLQRRPSGSLVAPRLAGHIHIQPWSTSSAVGRKQNPHHTNSHHRVWLSDAGRTGRPLCTSGVDWVGEENLVAPRRWNRQRKTEHYKLYEAELNALKPHDEKFALNTNVKFWTHLEAQGTKPGGQDKLDYVPLRNTGRHAKGSNYSGKFSTVKHGQMVYKTAGKNEPAEWQIDSRPPFDNRLKDDMIKYIDDNNRELARMSYDVLKGTNTRSCPQMGVDYMQR